LNNNFTKTSHNQNYMKYFLVFLTYLFLSVNVNAQSAEDSVKSVVNNLFTAMKNADTALLRTCFSENAVLQTIVRNKAGIATTRDEKVSDFADFLSKETKGNADERISFETIRIDADLASVWTPYQFYYKGTFSHCGVNSFQLVRGKNGWKIQYLIDTRRKTGCQ